MEKLFSIIRFSISSTEASELVEDPHNGFDWSDSGIPFEINGVIGKLQYGFYHGEYDEKSAKIDVVAVNIQAEDVKEYLNKEMKLIRGKYPDLQEGGLTYLPLPSLVADNDRLLIQYIVIYHVEHIENEPDSNTFCWSKNWKHFDGQEDGYEKMQRYIRLAENGDVQSMGDLGRMFYSGDEVDKDYAKAFEWSNRAVENGNVGAMLKLGILYYEGKGVDKDVEKAHELFMKVLDNKYAGVNIIAGLYLENNEFEKGMPFALASIHYNLRDQFVWQTLAKYYEGLGQLQNALDAYHVFLQKCEDIIMGELFVQITQENISRVEKKLERSRC